jgi:hypothetical protein
MKKIYLSLLLFLLAGCANRGYLSIQTVYLTRETLASYYVGTPDPMLIDPPVGQKLLVSWTVPRYYLNYQDLHLHVRIRLKNHEEVLIDVPVDKCWGSYTYKVANEAYFDCKGILTYKVDLIGNQCVLEEWKHQLWHELIRIGDKNESNQEQTEKSEDEDKKDEKSSSKSDDDSDNDNDDDDDSESDEDDEDDND